MEILFDPTEKTKTPQTMPSLRFKVFLKSSFWRIKMKNRMIIIVLLLFVGRVAIPCQSVHSSGVVGAPLIMDSYSQTQQTIKIKLYFPNTKRNSGDCSVKVYPVTRTIPRTDAVATAALEQLFAGPTSEEKGKGFYSDFSEATKSFLISVNVKNKVAYVNLRDLTSTSSIGNLTTSCGGSNFFGQVENTLKQFPSIKKAFFAMEGDPSLFYDWMQMGECPEELKNCDASNFIQRN